MKDKKDITKKLERHKQDYDPPTLRSEIFEAIGHASLCWTTPEQAGVFNTEEAIAIADGLLEKIQNWKYKSKKKDELKADEGLKQLGVKPRIYLFEENIKPFTAITIAEDRLTWAGVRRELDNIIPRVGIYPYGKATRLREELRRIDVYGVAICDPQEPNKNVRRGRVIAKGRLLKHLKKIGVRKVER